MKKAISMVLALTMTVLLAACGDKNTAEVKTEEGTTLVYGSGDYTRINPAMDEHGEINVLLFNGLTAHDGDNQVVPGLAESWDYDETTYTYTFHIRDGIRWHDGEPFTAKDVQFTIEAIMDPDNGSENAPNYEDVEEITVVDDQTISFRLAEPNVAFLEYMTMAVLPSHLLEGEDMQESDFFRHPVGTGPYQLERWDVGQSIVLTKNEDYYLGAPNIDTVIFKIVADDNAQAMQLESGELDLVLLDPKNAANFEGRDGFTCYDMTTADYRGILFNFANDYWTENRDLIPAICCALDRQAIIDSVLLGQGMAAYSPLQRNRYNNENVERYDYDPDRARQILEGAGCVLEDDGFYTRNGEPVGFTISVMAGEQDRIDIAQAAAQQLREVGIQCTVEIPAQMDWGGQMACLIGWGSPFDADDHTYKVFGTGKGANYSSYSNEKVDEYLTLARQSDDPAVRGEYYGKFQEELAKDPAYAFLCYIDANYVTNSNLQGIAADTVLGHHGVGIFWNIHQWTIG
ncbi:MAG TPA: ABC transporter substrate-binding protein [Candidatus Avoscillospira avistercoris]|uniref:ABC transporter substrate-binding protein n=1 Tax=Candidatus Avoscillospira avistercoris TaxID=2840707 RepID=A0A9D1F8L0_9FIRM|nr:ABC transporter substrate-binding protein [Candidatus Avoscillospira avistercoris]